VYELLQEQIPVVFLGEILNLELGVLLHEGPVLIVDSLGDLRHGVQVLVKLLLPLFEVVTVLLLPVVLGFQLGLDLL
jgi:hypothetical protein